MDWLNSPELKALRKAWHEAEKLQNAEDDAWWDSLNHDGKSQAFRQITKLMHKAEVLDKARIVMPYTMYLTLIMATDSRTTCNFTILSVRGLRLRRKLARRIIRMNAMMIHATSHCQPQGKHY
jgi:hypothetical protein